MPTEVTKLRWGWWCDQCDIGDETLDHIESEDDALQAASDHDDLHHPAGEPCSTCGEVHMRGPEFEPIATVVEWVEGPTS